MESKEFLQSVEWLRLQEATGKETLPFAEEDFSAHGIVHTLPLVGQYLYVPRGPRQSNNQSPNSNFQRNIQKLIAGAKERKMKWVRIEPETEEMLEEIKKTVDTLRQAQGGNLRVTKAPHDMQPREVLKIDISKTEEELLARMKSKARYNIRLAEKRGVRVFETREEKYIAAFLDLITATSGRKGIASHPRGYYEQFFQVLPQDMCQLFVAEYEGEVLAANMMIFFGETTTYLHGGSGDAHRDVMAPYLLQWEQIRVAKARGFRIYDFGGVSVNTHNSWQGITKFKTGFAPQVAPTLFPGAYDIVLDTQSYFLYDVLRFLQGIKKSMIG